MAPPAASAALGHPEILEALRAAFASRVFLLARLVESSLSLGGDRTAHVFIPDTHIVASDDVKRWPGRVLSPSRFDALAKLLDALAQLRQKDAGLTVWQLGDLLDLWRIGKTTNLSLEERLNLVNADWGKVLRRFERNAELPIRRLFGNHDEDLRRLPGIEERAFIPADPGDHASNDMLVSHGHQYDPIEDLPELLKGSFMRGFTERVTPYTQDLILSANPHWMPQADYSFTLPPKPNKDAVEKFVCFPLRARDPVPLSPGNWNVGQIGLQWHPDANPLEIEANRRAKWQDDVHPALWDRAKLRAEEAGGAGYSVGLVVVAHTHNPRIFLGRQPGGQSIALMDCGGWVGPQYLSPDLTEPIHKCHLGVRVGGDLRIYQLGADPYEWPN
jgi:hypothetical protein